MRSRLFILLSLILFLMASQAVAVDKTRQRTDAKTFSVLNTSHGAKYEGPYYFEGFEDAFPPSGWTQTITNATNTWVQALLDPSLEGLNAAYIHWDSVVPQDETLEFTYPIDVGAGEYVLSFWMAGSIGQTWDLNDVMTVEINGMTVWDFDSSVTVGYMEFDQYFIDLSGYNGTTVTITFRYTGLDGDAHYIDAVMVSDGSGYDIPPPPPVEFCDQLIEATGTGTFYGDTCDGQNLVSVLDCGDYTEAGLEDYYEVWMPAGSSFMATVTNTADGALWVLGECAAESGAFTCLAYADDTLTGEPEVISLANGGGSGGYVYLVIDSWGADSCGSYELVFESTGGAIPNQTMSLGEIKAIYR